MNFQTLHLLRHGKPEGAGRMHGHGDVAPLAEGVMACRQKAGGLNITHIISSDLVRAAKPAHAIADDLGVTLCCDPRWRELDFGAWDGCDPAALPIAELAAFWDDPESNPPPGGEGWQHLLQRVNAALDDSGEQTLVVTHAGAMRAALCLLLRLNYVQSWAFDLPYAALVSLRIWPGQPRRAQMIGLAT